MKHSSPLSPAARELLSLGSLVEPPTAEQCERMDRAFARVMLIERALPPTSPGHLGQRGAFDARARIERAGAVEAARRALLGLGSSAGKLALALGALAVTGGASFWLGRASAPASADSARVVPAMASPPVGAPLPAPFDTSLGARPAEQRDLGAASPLPAALLRDGLPATLPPETLPPDALPSIEPLAPAASSANPVAAHAPVPADVLEPSTGARPHPAPSRATRPSASLAAEIERLARVEAALRQGHARQALAELREPTTHLHEQAAALRAVAQCELDSMTASITGSSTGAGSAGAVSGASHVGAADGARGAEAARDALRRWPSSPFGPRIRAACGL